MDTYMHQHIFDNQKNYDIWDIYWSGEKRLQMQGAPDEKGRSVVLILREDLSRRGNEADGLFFTTPIYMRIGLDILLTDQRELLKGKRLGVLAHQASLNSKGEHIVPLLNAEKKEWHLTTLFGPEHGLETAAEDMEAVESSTHTPTGLPIFSLYGKSPRSLKPTGKMLENIDCLVIDLQDVGTRYYTYIWTALLCMEMCAKLKKEVIVCDRPNPINGLTLEGELNQKGFTSFVGLYPIPIRHGMTVGELTRFLNDTQDINCSLQVVCMEGWQREWFWEETGLVWNDPSPNMRSPAEALLYPGTCLLEGTNISEGRGTDTPFEILGAPFIRPQELIDTLGEKNLPGITFETTQFAPVFQKWEKQICHGIRMRVTDRQTFRPFETGVTLIWALFDLYQEKGFEWRAKPYEFIDDIPAIDLLTGSSILRQGLEKNLPLSEILEWIGTPPENYVRQRTPYLLY